MELDRLLAQLDETGLAEFFSVNALARARGYVGRVRGARGHRQHPAGPGPGQRAPPYKVWVRIERREFLGQRSIDLATRCTCPVGNRCKHAAALILARGGGSHRRQAAGRDPGLGPRPSAAARRALKAPRKSPVRDGIVTFFAPGREATMSSWRSPRRASATTGASPAAWPEWTAYEQALLKPPSFVQEQDLRILRLLRQLVRRNGLYAWPVLRGEEGYALFECALESGRAWLDPPRRAAAAPSCRGSPPGATGVGRNGQRYAAASDRLATRRHRRPQPAADLFRCRQRRGRSA